MNVLIGCECSGRVRDAFSRLGHNAWSCDLKPSETAGRHIQGNLLDHLDGCYPGHGRSPVPWDLLIFHPDCTYFANSGVLRLVKGKLGVGKWIARGCPIDQFDRDRWAKLLAAALFVKQVLEEAQHIPKLGLENPVMHGYAKHMTGLGDPTQSIQPYEFGDPASKRTCLWLKNLPPLVPTNRLPLPDCGYWSNQTPNGQNKLGPSPTRKADRARTYPGIAEAMAEQWGREDGTNLFTCDPQPQRPQEVIRLVGREFLPPREEVVDVAAVKVVRDGDGKLVGAHAMPAERGDDGGANVSLHGSLSDNNVGGADNLRRGDRPVATPPDQHAVAVVFNEVEPLGGFRVGLRRRELHHVADLQTRLIQFRFHAHTISTASGHSKRKTGGILTLRKSFTGLEVHS